MAWRAGAVSLEMRSLNLFGVEMDEWRGLMNGWARYRFNISCASYQYRLTHIHMHSYTYTYLSTYLGTGEGVAQDRGQGAGSRGVAEDGVPGLDGGEPRCWILVSAFFGGVRCVFFRGGYMDETTSRRCFWASSLLFPSFSPMAKAVGMRIRSRCSGLAMPAVCGGGGVVFEYFLGL